MGLSIRKMILKGPCTQIENILNTPRHDKTNNVRPAKTHVGLGIRPDWLETSLYAFSGAYESNLLHTNSDDSDAQADLSLRCAHRSFYWFRRAQTH